MRIDEMAKLFDVDLDNSLSDDESSDYKSQEPDSNLSFVQKCETVLSVMSPSTVVSNEKKAVHETIDVKQNVLPISKEINSIEIPDSTNINNSTEENNSLGLSGRLLIAYNMIKEKYPQFKLDTDSVSFKDFYKWKVDVLANLLTRFSILPLNDMRLEIREVCLDHYVGESYASPEIIRKKIDDAYRCRIRLSVLLMECHEQFPMWKRMVELLQSKLFKDHDTRGEYKREALSLEHISDLDMYYHQLKGFIDAARVLDDLLKAAAESLSRQLSCIQIKEPTGTTFEQVAKIVAHDAHDAYDAHKSTNERSYVNGLDVINCGTKISRSGETSSLPPVDFGGNDEADDFLMKIG